MDYNYKLPYTKENIGLITDGKKLRVDGKSLNHLPMRLLDNDKYINSKMNLFTKEVDWIEGEGDRGVIEHIEKYILSEKNYNKTINNCLVKFTAFLEDYKAIQEIPEFFTCIKFNEDCDNKDPNNKYNVIIFNCW